MFVGTHASLPVILATAVNAAYLKHKGRPLFRVRHLGAIAVGGGLPDIIWPHLSLHARLTSWSHTVWFLAALIPILILFGRKLLGPGWKPAAVAAWLAAALHLAVDTISGGTAPLYPLGGRVGIRTISFHYWIFVDFVTVPLAVLCFLWTRRISRAGTQEATPDSGPGPVGKITQPTTESGFTRSMQESEKAPFPPPAQE